MTAQEAVNVYRMARFGNNDGLKKLLSVIFFFLRCTTLISTQDPSARDRAGLYDINATDDAGATALIYAARAGYVGVIKQLLAHGASATKEGYGGLAPLHHALIHLREPACHALLEAGADPNQADSGGHTSLHFAAQVGALNVLITLLERGGDAKQQSTNKTTPLHVAAQTGAEAIVLRLLEAGADPNQADSGGHTALSIAKRMGYSSIVALLEEHQK